MYNKNINKKKSHFHLRTMSSTHSDSNSKKVYRQPQEPTITGIVVACKEFKSKVEELFQEIHTYDLNAFHMNKTMEMARDQLAKVQFTVLEKLAKVLARGTNRSEDEKRMAKIEHYEKIIKEQKDKLSTAGKSILSLPSEIEHMASEMSLLAHTWAKNVTDGAKQDLLRFRIAAENFICIQDTAKAVNSKYTELQEAIDIFSRSVRWSVSSGSTIGFWKYIPGKSQLDWIYSYPRGLTNQKIIEFINHVIRFSEDSAHLFPSPSSAKPDTQTA
jgi:hypothetical protein